MYTYVFKLYIDSLLLYNQPDGFSSPRLSRVEKRLCPRHSREENYNKQHMFTFVWRGLPNQFWKIFFFDLYPDQLLFEWLSLGYPLLPRKTNILNLKITPKWIQGNSSTQSTSIVFPSHLCGSGEVLHPRNLTWNPKMKVWKMFVLFTRVILRFMLVFQGVFQ